LRLRIAAAPADAPHDGHRLGALLGHQAGACREEAIIATETELKLAARPRDLPALVRLLEAKAAGGGAPSRPRQLISTYYDTPGCELRRQGLALRVRQRNGHFIQGVKSDPQFAGIGLPRGEWEDEIAGGEPDPQAPQSGRLLDAALGDRLVPLFRTEIGRRTLDLSPAPETQIAAAIDRGRIYALARDAGEAVSEVELELKGGDAAALYDVALDLLAVASVRLERRTKAERGYDLAAGAAPAVAAAHAEPVALDPGLSGDEALRRIGLSCIDQIMRNEAAVCASLPEGIHQMRVGVRRLRAVLSAFARLLPAEERRAVSDEARWLADALGAARNLDVFGKFVVGAAPPNVGQPAGRAALVAAVAQRRETAYAQAVRVVRSRRYTALLLHLLRWFGSCGWRSATVARALDQPIGNLSGAVLDRRLRAVKRRSKGFAGQSARQRHRLRIALKKLRYATEVLAELYPAKACEGFGTRLKRLQDDLGDANDVRVGRDIVADLAGRSERSAAIADAGNALLEWHERRLAERERKLKKHFDRLLDAEPFWKG
jgi:inorganic triphosphatase YgiF